jgi:DNA end-binding protein Ku
MRAVFRTSISFGLVNVPVGVFKATESHDIKFQMHHAGCLGRIGFVRTCKDCGEVVAYDDIVKGIERDDTLVIFTEDELSDVETEVGRELEVVQFVHADEIDPIMFESPYYLAPAQKASKSVLEGYALLRVVLEESQRVGIVRYTVRNKTRIAALRVMGDVLVLQNLTWPDELRPADFSVLQKKVTLAPRAVKMAHQIVETMLGTFEPAEFTDDYMVRLNEVIDAKAANSEVPAAKRKETEDVSDLIAALEASVKGAK